MQLKAWALAARPKTLVAGVVPVAVGSALAFHDGAFSPLVALAALAGALFIQAGTNLANDYYDFKKGADTSKRLGPPRATQQGWLAPKSVLKGAGVCFALAFVIGIFLVKVAGLPIVIIGLTSLLAGYAYTGGPFPLAYNGLGDLFVLVFFGFVAVGGTYFAQTLTMTTTAFLAAIPVGLLAVALLAVNNTRDAETDIEAGKRTLVVRFGTGFGKAEYVVAILVSALVPLLLWATGRATVWVLLPLASLPLAVPPARLVLQQRGAILNQALAGTARLQLVFGALFAIGLTR